MTGRGYQTHMEISLYPKYLIRSLLSHDRRSFFNAGYKLLYPEYSRRGMTPWQHYVTEGKRKGLGNGNNPPEDFFFREGYELEYPDVKNSGYDSWQHYAEKGLAEGRDNGNHPSEELFFAAGYLEMYPDAANSGMDPWHHYVLVGKKEGRDSGHHPSENLFFAAGYIEMYQDAANSGMDPWHHYVLIGKKEGRDNGLHPKVSQFFARGYLEMHPDVARSGMDPWRHYVLSGKKEGRNNGLHPKDSMFFAPGYLAMYPDVAKSGMDPWHHYVLVGKKEGRDNGLHPKVSQFFARGYLEMHPDVARSGMDPWRHYVLSGKKEGRNNSDGSQVSSSSMTWFVPCNTDYQDSADINSFPGSCKRCAVFSAHSDDNTVSDRVLDYLCILGDSADFIIAVYDEPLPAAEIDKLRGFANAVCCVEHNTGEFGSYKIGINILKNKHLLSLFDELVLCSCSALIPSDFFKKYFAGTAAIARECDFYGWSEINAIKPHLQSLLICFSKKVFASSCFISFFNSVRLDKDAGSQVPDYEKELTESLSARGFTFSSLLKTEDYPETQKYDTAEDISYFPISIYKRLGYSLVRHEILDKLGCNRSGIFNFLSFLEKSDNDFFRKILRLYPDYVSKYESYKARKTGFSFIIPTYNRAGMIAGSIDSILQQNYDNYEIIVSDDASTDNTVRMLKKRYAGLIKQGILKILLNDGKGKGVCHARNLALSVASKEFIAYLDSDNRILPNFLDNFVDAILLEPERQTFYGKSYRMQKNGWKSLEKKFDLSSLKKSNFIDLGIFVHSRSLLQLGMFDENLHRLVDWDLIVRYTSVCEPVWVSNVVMEYNNTDDYPRITNSVELQPAYDAVRKKIDDRSVTTIILAYNHELYISETIESALMQDYGFGHKILISDDMSSDCTRKIIRYYADRYSDVITDISTDVNKGFSGNLKHCLEHVNTKYVEILEGDDYYVSPDKVKIQEEVLTCHPEYMMVFSKLRLFNTRTLKFSYLTRQENLGDSVTSDDFLNEPTLNLIANFTSCMFRTDFLRILPERAFQPRLTEMAVAFTALKFGKIGYVNVPLNVYRVHEGSLWSGKSKLEQLREGYEVRKTLRAISGIKRLDPIIEEYEKRIQSQKIESEEL